MEKVSSKDPIVSLLYSILRDHIQPGVLEQIVQDIENYGVGTEVVFTNGYLANYSEDIVKRLQELNKTTKTTKTDT